MRSSRPPIGRVTARTHSPAAHPDCECNRIRFFVEIVRELRVDPLSEVLSLLETRDSFFTGLRAGGPWAVDLPPPDGQ